MFRVSRRSDRLFDSLDFFFFFFNETGYASELTLLIIILEKYECDIDSFFLIGIEYLDQYLCAFVE